MGTIILDINSDLEDSLARTSDVDIDELGPVIPTTVGNSFLSCQNFTCHGDVTV
jgi:hypothetical protein